MQAEEIDRQLKMPNEQLEAERSAEHMAKMRAEIAELRARAEGDQQREFISAGAETEPRKSQTKRSKA
jgi:head-tail adaptor